MCVYSAFLLFSTWMVCIPNSFVVEKDEFPGNSAGSHRCVASTRTSNRKFLVCRSKALLVAPAQV